MWKLVVGFIVFAALALYLLTKGGDIDMGGEKHGLTPPHRFFYDSLIKADTQWFESYAAVPNIVLIGSRCDG